MSIMNVDIYDQLKEFGIERTLAQEAAKRYGSMEAAVDWCFGPGANWKPDEELPSYGSLNTLEPVEHRENASTAPPLPPRSPRAPATAFANLASPPSTSFASNNPFKSNPPPPDAITDDHDEDLQRAIQMSQQTSGSVTPASESEEEIRMQGERSVRATAPPPSPSPDDMPSLEPLFGPSNKTEDGSTALVTLPNPDKEEEDLNRAIQDSLMTASFHSASAFQGVDKPEPTLRYPGAPLVLYSQSGEMTFAALFLQAMMAVPQLREVFREAPVVVSETESSQKVQTSLKSLEAQSETGEESFVEIDALLRELTYRTSQLPPDRPTRDLLDRFESHIATNWLAALLTDPALAETRPRGGRWDKPELLFKSVIYQPKNIASFVTFRRAARLPNNLYAHLADILWARDALPSSIQRLAEVLVVFIAWDVNVKREIWKLEERVVLDRYMKDEEMWAAQVRAEQGVASGNVRRLRERIERLTYHNGCNFQESIAALIKHYAGSPPSDDPVQAITHEEMKAKLVKTLSILKTKVNELQAELDAALERANGELFVTVDPERNKHMYLLRAVLFHDGSLVGGRHLYGYFRTDDSRWWRVQEHEVSLVDWKDVEGDATGVYMEGGPYQLRVVRDIADASIYSRDGPAPPSESSTPTTSGSEMEGVEVKPAAKSEQDLITLDEPALEAEKPSDTDHQQPTTKAEDLIVLD